MEPEKIIRGNGVEEWFLNHKRHRLDGPAYTEPVRRMSQGLYYIYSFQIIYVDDFKPLLKTMNHFKSKYHHAI